jgi:hypothetical protein
MTKPGRHYQLTTLLARLSCLPPEPATRRGWFAVRQLASAFAKDPEPVQGAVVLSHGAGEGPAMR